MSAPLLPQSVAEDFAILLAAAQQGQLTLRATTDTRTGEAVYVLLLLVPGATPDTVGAIPIARLFTDDAAQYLARPMEIAPAPAEPGWQGPPPYTAPVPAVTSMPQTPPPVLPVAKRRRRRPNTIPPTRLAIEHRDLHPTDGEMHWLDRTAERARRDADAIITAFAEDSHADD